MTELSKEQGWNLKTKQKHVSKQKGRKQRKKDHEGRHVIVKKYKSFVKRKRIFWKQGTDDKSLFSGMNRDKDGWMHWADERTCIS